MGRRRLWWPYRYAADVLGTVPAMTGRPLLPDVIVRARTTQCAT